MRYRAVVGAVLLLCAWCGSAQAASIEGTNGRDVLRATAQPDVVVGKAGDDVLLGRAGEDRLYGGPGADSVRGHEGPDSLYGGPGADRMHGYEGQDRLYGGAGNDVLIGGPGPDLLSGGPNDDRLVGGPGADRISCGAGKDTALLVADDIVADDCETVTEVDTEDEDSWSWSDTFLAALGIAIVLAIVLGTIPLSRQILPGTTRVELRTAPEERPAPLADWMPYMFPFPVLGIVGITVYTLDVGDASAFAAALLVAGGAFLAGGLFGFLFGIPKSLARSQSSGPQAGPPRRFDPNTNLEEISDWLTKIIVGLTLIQLGELIDGLQDFANFLAPSLGGEEGADAYAIAILLVFGISGFLIAYLATRMYVGQAFATAEGALAQAVVTVSPAQQPAIDDKIRGFVETSRSS